MQLETALLLAACSWLCNLLGSQTSDAKASHSSLSSADIDTKPFTQLGRCRPIESGSSISEDAMDSLGRPLPPASGYVPSSHFGCLEHTFVQCKHFKIATGNCSVIPVVNVCGRTVFKILLTPLSDKPLKKQNQPIGYRVIKTHKSLVILLKEARQRPEHQLYVTII